MTANCRIIEEATARSNQPFVRRPNFLIECFSERQLNALNISNITSMVNAIV